MDGTKKWMLFYVTQFISISLQESTHKGYISFICPGCAEHVLVNEVVWNTLREQTEQCAGCTTF
jgi:hypothetical protein